MLKKTFFNVKEIAIIKKRIIFEWENTQKE
jgi:hypothetical protein